VKSGRCFLVCVSFIACVDVAAVPPCPDGAGPRAAVMGYLTAMHEHRFGDAFDFVTDTMTDGLERGEWSAIQNKAYAPGKVDIYGVDVRRAVGVGGDPDCHARAIVPNVLSSRDKLNVYGSVEFEIYSLIREGGVWRVDSQETLFDDNAIMTWFPDVTTFEAGGEE
jgi:hypothetical protein